MSTTNFNMAVEYGINYANMVKQNGTIVLGLIGSGLDADQVDQVFQAINKVTPVAKVSAEPGLALTMTKL